MLYRRSRYLLMMGLMGVYYGCCQATDTAVVREPESPNAEVSDITRDVDERAAQESKAAKRPDAMHVPDDLGKGISERQAIEIAEGEVRKRFRIKSDKTLRSDASHHRPGEVPSMQFGWHKESGWMVLVWLVPFESGGHWFVFVTDSGRVADLVGGV
jgi:hypothetical protein